MNSNYSDIDMFSRGGIEMTFTILRNHNPKIALTVRNILNDAEEYAKDKSQLYRVSLEKAQVAEIAAALEAELESIESPGMMMMTKALVGDWKKLLESLNE